MTDRDKTRTVRGHGPATGSSPHGVRGAAPVPHVRDMRVRIEWADRLLSADPGLVRLRVALHGLLTVTLALAAEWLFVRLTHALQLPVTAASPPAENARTAAVNHQFLVIAMMLGAIVGLIASTAVADRTPRGRLITTLLLPAAMIAALTLGTALGGHRVPALILMALILAAGTYARRFGPRGFVAGLVGFVGYFLGFFLHGAVPAGRLGWLAAEIGVGTAVAVVVQFAFFAPHPVKALERTWCSYAARARKVAALALELFDDPGHTERDLRRLHHQLVRLNEAALMIDAHLGDPDALPEGASGRLLHQRLFDLELALTNVVRFAQAMARLDLPAEQRYQIRSALLDVVWDDEQAARMHANALIDLLRAAGPPPPEQDRTTAVLPHRFAENVIALADAMTTRATPGATDNAADAFEPSVTLIGGWLPGSTHVSATASRESGARRGERIRLEPYTRAAIQMGIAVSAAIAVGDLLSGRRFYWAVIAAFIAFVGTHNSGEQVRKALFRVVGTVAGIAVGSLLATAVGHDTAWSLAVILASLFLGLYLIRISYLFMAAAVTVAICQLYVQLDEFSNTLLVLRLEETALGAAVAIAVATLVLPLHSRRVLRVALRDHIQALRQLVDHATGRLIGEGDATDGALRADARALDATYHALEATARSVGRTVLGAVDEDAAQVIRLASATCRYGRKLAADLDQAEPLGADARRDLERAHASLHEGLDVVAEALTGSRDAVYIRSSSLFDQAEQSIEQHRDTPEPVAPALRNLKLIDGTIAQLAQAMGLRITDYDTVPGHRPAPDTPTQATASASRSPDPCGLAS